MASSYIENFASSTSHPIPKPFVKGDRVKVQGYDGYFFLHRQDDHFKYWHISRDPKWLSYPMSRYEFQMTHAPFITLPTLADNVARLQATQREMIERAGYKMPGVKVKATELEDDGDNKQNFPVGSFVKRKDERDGRDDIYKVIGVSGDWRHTINVKYDYKYFGHISALSLVGFPIGSLVTHEYRGDKVFKVVGEVVLRKNSIFCFCSQMIEHKSENGMNDCLILGGIDHISPLRSNR